VNQKVDVIHNILSPPGMTPDDQERIRDMIDDLANMHARRALLVDDKKRAIEAAMPVEVVKALADIDAEFDMEARHVDSNITEREGEVRMAVLTFGDTIKAAYGRATWNKPRVTWDNKGLDGYAIAHPEINVFRKVGEPSVSITMTGIK